jgi:hypothetical protein
MNCSILRDAPKHQAHQSLTHGHCRLEIIGQHLDHASCSGSSLERLADLAIGRMGLGQLLNLAGSRRKNFRAQFNGPGRFNL